MVIILFNNLKPKSVMKSSTCLILYVNFQQQNWTFLEFFKKELVKLGANTLILVILADHNSVKIYEIIKFFA